ncbi:GNAT family N-acetyltransferase [Sulfitobacter sp. THAF37]|uniref:GNAT family N-acetyltransferase n=1 Tax=Sulfitobacter sp. THAF37 TaxID=2587855 RepID=UPI001268DA2E|nr:GNAT family N-acetyltransferase [Sulfitobacter sp. THAF37]
MDFTISKGFAEAERARVADLYWTAFSGKLRHVLGPPAKALEFLSDHLDPEFALVARDADQQVQGVAGFKTAEGSLVGGNLRDIARVYGVVSACWRGPLLALVERDLTEDTLLMDGICVAPDGRGQGLGSALLTAIKDRARAQGKSCIRLDVIDTNPRARALYDRFGFEAAGQESLGPFRLIFGFRTATRMICPV